MTKNNKRSRPIPTNIQESYNEARNKAVVNCFKLINNCLSHYAVSNQMKNELLSEIGTILNSNVSNDEICDDISQLPDISIIRGNGKKLVLRKSINGQHIELGRFDSLEDSLLALHEREPEFFRIVEPKKWPIEVWCTYCLDDPEVMLCSFCGCRKCFGKHDSEYLILCDECDEEAHTYCLEPKLLEIPKDEWYCQSCVMSKCKDIDSDALNADIVSDSSLALPNVVENIRVPIVKPVNFNNSTSFLNLAQASFEVPIVPKSRGRPKGSRGRGRPFGSVKQRLPLSTTSLTNVTGNRYLWKRTMHHKIASSKFRQGSLTVKRKHFLANLVSQACDNNKIVEDNIHSNIMSVESALFIVNKMTERELTTKEKENLKVFREFAPKIAVKPLPSAGIELIDNIGNVTVDDGDDFQLVEVNDLETEQL